MVSNLILFYDLFSAKLPKNLLLYCFKTGGSALLPAPVEPLTLQEKLSVVNLLSCKGATINEINIVRKNLSAVKGGQLAEMTYPAKVSS